MAIGRLCHSIGGLKTEKCCKFWGSQPTFKALRDQYQPNRLFGWYWSRKTMSCAHFSQAESNGLTPKQFLKLMMSGEDIDLLPYIVVCFMLSVWYAKHTPIAFVFKRLDSPLQIRHQRPPLTSIEQYWQDKWFVEFDLCGKRMALFSNSIRQCWVYLEPV